MKEIYEIKERRPYERVSITAVSMFPGSSLLAGSIVKNSTIQATGQELGPEYDMTVADTDVPSADFNHNWE